MDGFLAGDDEDRVAKKPAAGASLLAIADKKRPAATGDTASLKKRPAAHNAAVNKKPASATGTDAIDAESIDEELAGTTALTEANVQGHNEALEGQNSQVNQAIENSMKQVQGKIVVLAATKQKLETFSCSGSQGKIKGVILEDLAELETEMDKTNVALRHAFVVKFDSNHLDDKVTLLNTAAAQISELNSLVKSTDQMMKQKN